MPKVKSYTREEIAAISYAESVASNWLYDRGYTGATDAECECLLDPTRALEARGMVDHWEARCGLPEHMAQAITDKLR